MIMRKEQMDAFRLSSIDSFKQRARTRLEPFYADRIQALGTQSLDAFIDHEFERAKRYHAMTEMQFFTFIECALYYGAGFIEAEQNWWAKDFLVVADIDPGRRYEIVRQYADLRCGGML
ncbi:hypothetical protein [Pseudomonas sp. R16(2017)]|uniref:hypothetical protein n=1 Tax=Pseudomonas sp. R16(2017) TaxID=1981704 RepID=UPI000A1FC416|nr:hypothetical protein [Pseudomonas sp. R16(2017)]